MLTDPVRVENNKHTDNLLYMGGIALRLNKN